MTVSYRPKFANDGTHYNQTITMALSDLDINRINATMTAEKAALYHPQNIVRRGLNFVTLTARDIILSLFKIENPRVLDRNTVFNII